MIRKRVEVKPKDALQLIGAFIFGVFLGVFGGVFFADTGNSLYLLATLIGLLVVIRFVFFGKAALVPFHYNSIVNYVNFLDQEVKIPKFVETMAEERGRSVSDAQQYYLERIQHHRGRALEAAKRRLEDLAELDRDFPYLDELREALDQHLAERPFAGQ